MKNTSPKISVFLANFNTFISNFKTICNGLIILDIIIITIPDPVFEILVPNAT